MIDNKLTYVSLFSSAGVGCYGFKKAGYKCIATNELIERRLNIQKVNEKCDFETGYIKGDIKDPATKKKIFEEIERWEKLGNNGVDVLIATPPCQGMSVANHKKTANEIDRNSLVVESIKMIKEIMPKIFIFENVSAFMKTGCTDIDGNVKTIKEAIYSNLGKDYSIYSKVLNFKNYGSNSSRTRTLVIGINEKIKDDISPLELFPSYQKEKTLKEVIGDLNKLEWGEFDENDFYHQFRTYPVEMRKWIHNVKPGHSAFENELDEEKPHKIENGKIVININKNGDKYTRQEWNKVAPCIHTRNDQMASQNTVHPEEDRVFSIRELMRMMTIPDDFKWIDLDLKTLNKLPLEEKKKLLKKEEINIRQSIGEAVPTNIFYQVAENIKNKINENVISEKEINSIIQKNNLTDCNNLLKYIKKSKYSYSTLARIAELSNTQREQNGAYYTNKFIVTEMVKQLDDVNKDKLDIIEPSVGVGNFLPLLIKKYDYVKELNIDVVDIDKNNIEILKVLLSKIKIPANVKINYISDDFLTHEFTKNYDICIGNPPFTKMKSNDKKLKEYIKNSINKESYNLVAFFWEKCLKMSNIVNLVSPKNILNTPEYFITRKILNKYAITNIIDFGELGFKGVLIETVAIVVNKNAKRKNSIVESIPKNLYKVQNQDYITDNELPYWIIYRNELFDRVSRKMTFGIFDVFRDRQLTNSIVNSTKNSKSDIRVIKSRNIDDTGENIINISGYDSYISKNVINDYSVNKYINAENIYMTPNMTYKPRIMIKPKNTVTNGSVALLIPKDKNEKLTEKQMKFLSSSEYRDFYALARNFQTRSLNVDNNSVYFFGKLKEE